MKNGFTLIELLAVIVVLAIIALIAVPVVLNIINDAKESSLLRSAEFYLDAANYTIANAFLYHGGLSNGQYPITPDGDICKTALPCTEENTLKVEVAGDKPTSGTITITEGKIKNHNLVYESNITIIDGEISVGEVMLLSEYIIKDAIDNNYYYETAPNFSLAPNKGEFGLYNVQDDLGTSYYFRGDVKNNYVEFGEIVLTPGWYMWHDVYASDDGWTNTNVRFDTEEECRDSEFRTFLEYQNSYDCRYQDTTITYKNYWRIVRINGDDTIRLIYDGTILKGNGEYRNATFDQQYQMPTNTWYSVNLKAYESLIEEGMFCNDKEFRTIVIEHDSPDGFDYEEEIIYSVFERLYNTPQPILTCKEEYRVYEKMLLISADEALMAGAIWDSSSENYYLANGAFLTSSLYGEAELAVGNEGFYFYGYEGDRLFRPVINLKKDVKFTGLGTINSPYVIIAN